MVLEVALGVAGPLVASVGTWLLMERAYRRHPERLTALMLKAFAAKMVFFAAYVAIVLNLFVLRPIPFVVSFTIAFITLHFIQALGLGRLFSAR